MKRLAFLAAVLACGCTSSSPPSAAPPSRDVWALRSSWSGGKPPGLTTRTVLESTGAFTYTNSEMPSRPAGTCEVSLSASVIAPITAELATAKLEPGMDARDRDGVDTLDITIDAKFYRLPSKADAPRLHAAIEAAMLDGYTLCATK